MPILPLPRNPVMTETGVFDSAAVWLIERSLDVLSRGDLHG